MVMKKDTFEYQTFRQITINNFLKKSGSYCGMGFFLLQSQKNRCKNYKKTSVL